MYLILIQKRNKNKLTKEREGKVLNKVSKYRHCLTYWLNTVFAHVICALFFPILAADKSGCVKYADFFVEVLIWVLF